MYCSRCGREIDDKALMCPYCGTKTMNNLNTFITNDQPSFGYAFISFIIPIVGFILYLIYRDERPKRAKSALKGAAAGIVVYILVVISIIAFSFYYLNNIRDNLESSSIDETIEDSIDYLDNDDYLFDLSSEELLQDYVDVSIGNFEITDNGYYPETKLNVTVKNKDDTRRSYTVEIEAVDATGARIDTDYIYVNNLNSNQEIHLEAFKFVTEDKLEQLKNATFKVLEVSGY